MDSLRRGTARKPARTAGALNKSFRNWGRRFSVISGSCLIIWLIVTSTSVLPAHIFRRIRTVPRKTRASVHTRRNVDQIRVAMVCNNDALFAEGAHSAERLRRSRDLVRSSPCCSYSRMMPVRSTVTALRVGSNNSNATDHDADKRHDRTRLRAYPADSIAARTASASWCVFWRNAALLSRPRSVPRTGNCRLNCKLRVPVYSSVLRSQPECPGARFPAHVRGIV